jgi:hypothetical protein
MANARLYSLNTTAKNLDSYCQKLTGQAKIVMSALKEDTTPRLAVQIEDTIKDVLKTRQSTLRVTLYYIIVFKSKGLIHVHENKTVEEETVLE